MMSSSVTMNEDVTLEIISRCSSRDIEKFRLLNKTLNKRSHEMYFIDLHLHRTNSVLGFFIQHLSRFISIEEGSSEKSGISLDFLPSRDVKIEACDTRHGILLCVDYKKHKGRRSIPDYIVCKPATKQYRIIANPKTRYFTIACSLMVIQSNPIQYKIVRVSDSMRQERRREKQGFFNLKCEVFDSATSAWKRLDDLELPEEESFAGAGHGVSSCGFLYWLTSKNKLTRFCMRTETWSFMPVPRDVEGDDGSLDLISYEGKVGMICSTSEHGCYSLRVLEKSYGKSWVYVKDVKIEGLNEHAKPLWFLSNDVLSMACLSRIALYNMGSNRYRYKRLEIQHRLPLFLPRDYCFPFYSNHERVCL